MTNFLANIDCTIVSGSASSCSSVPTLLSRSIQASFSNSPGKGILARRAQRLLIVVIIVIAGHLGLKDRRV